MSKKTLRNIVACIGLLLPSISSAQSILFSDDFNNTNKWMPMNGKWRIVNDNGNLVYNQTEFIGGGGNWRSSQAKFYGSNYLVEIDIKLVERMDSDAGASIQVYKKTSASFSEDPSDPCISLALFPREDRLSLYVSNEGKTTEYTYSRYMDMGVWYRVGVEVRNGLANAYFQGGKVISGAPTDLKEGFVQLTTDDFKAYFDNIRIVNVETQSGMVFSLQ